MEHQFTISIQSDKFNELKELTEEPDFSKSVCKALSLYYECLKLTSMEFRLCAVPTNIMDDKLDNERNIIFINFD